MLVNRSLKTLGYFRKDSASVEPPSTSRAILLVTSRRALESLCSERIERHCAIGRPASTIVENWRAVDALPLALTFPPVFFMPPGLAVRFRPPVPAPPPPPHAATAPGLAVAFASSPAAAPPEPAP